MSDHNFTNTCSNGHPPIAFNIPDGEYYESDCPMCERDKMLIELRAAPLSPVTEGKDAEDRWSEVRQEAAAREATQLIIIESAKAAGYLDSTQLDSRFKHELTERITAKLAASVPAIEAEPAALSDERDFWRDVYTSVVAVLNEFDVPTHRGEDELTAADRIKLYVLPAVSPSIADPDLAEAQRLYERHRLFIRLPNPALSAEDNTKEARRLFMEWATFAHPLWPRLVARAREADAVWDEAIQITRKYQQRYEAEAERIKSTYGNEAEEAELESATAVGCGVVRLALSAARDKQRGQS